MEPVIPDLYASDPSPLPFAPTQGIRAFLLRRDAGNLLVYSSPAVDAGAAAAGRVGEVVGVQVIPRPHEDTATVLPLAGKTQTANVG